MAPRGILARHRTSYRTPDPHPSGARPPKIPGELVPKHVAVVNVEMDAANGFGGAKTNAQIVSFEERRHRAMVAELAGAEIG